MPRISPFKGLLFDEAVVGAVAGVTAPPYDTVGERARRLLERLSPHNIVRLDLGESRHDDEVEPDRYGRAAELLGRWRAEGALKKTERPSWFVYEMCPVAGEDDHRILGLIAQVDVEPWGGLVVPHEQTMPGPVEDRLWLLRALRTNLSPVYAVFPGPRPELARFLEEIASTPPRSEATDEDAVRHRLWVVEGEIPDLPQAEPLMIADGHHRYTTALRYRRQMREVHGPGPWDQTMMFLVDTATQRPPVLPIHRIVIHDMPAVDGDPAGDLEDLLDRLDDEHGSFGIVSREPNGHVDALRHLLVSVPGPPPTVRGVHEELLRDVDGLRFTHDAVEAEAAVRSGEAQAAVLLPATSAQHIRSVIDAGQRLPQKSTFFWPKPRTGMVLRPLEEP